MCMDVIDLTKYIPELNIYKEQGIIFNGIYGDDNEITLEFYKEKEDARIKGSISIFLYHDVNYTKETILKIIKESLVDFYVNK